MTHWEIWWLIVEWGDSLGDMVVHWRCTTVDHWEMWWLIGRCGGSLEDVVSHCECGSSLGDEVAHLDK